jgi:hypothetical protein
VINCVFQRYTDPHSYNHSSHFKFPVKWVKKKKKINWLMADSVGYHAVRFQPISVSQTLLYVGLLTLSRECTMHHVLTRQCWAIYYMTDDSETSRYRADLTQNKYMSINIVAHRIIEHHYICHSKPTATGFGF